MSLDRFKQAVTMGRLSDADREWFPRWFAGYEKFLELQTATASKTHTSSHANAATHGNVQQPQLALDDSRYTRPPTELCRSHKN